MTVANTEAAAIAALRAAVIAVSELPDSRVILGRSSLPQRADSYIALRRVTGQGIGRTHHDYRTPTKWVQQRSVTMQVDAVGEDAITRLETVHALVLSDAPVRAALHTAEVGVTDVGPMRDLTRLLKQGAEPVAGFDVTLSFSAIIWAQDPDSVGELRVLVSVVGPGDPVGPAEVLTEPVLDAALASTGGDPPGYAALIAALGGGTIPL